MSDKLITIITPTFNHEKFIGACIESVLSQTYPNWEQIIIDDGSTDRTGEVVASYNDPRITYIRQEHRGIERLADTYNTALKAAKGDYVAILEGDDYWPHYKLKLQVEDFKDDAVVLSFGYTLEIGADGLTSRLIPTSPLPAEVLCNDPIGRATLYMMKPTILTFLFPASVMIRKSALEAIGGFQQPSYLPLVDYPTFFQLTMRGKMAFHNEVLGFWRRHPRSVTMNAEAVIREGVHRYLQECRAGGLPPLAIDADELAAVDREWKMIPWYTWFMLANWFMADGERDKARRAFRKCRELCVDWRHHILCRAFMSLTYMRLRRQDVVKLLRLCRFQDTFETINRHNTVISKDMLPDL